MLNTKDIKKLGEQLLPLRFDIVQDSKLLKNPLVQRYLDHYKINFSKTVPNVQHGFGTLETNTHTIALHYWLPEMPRATIFVVHGYNDHVGIFNHLIRFSLQNDYAVVAFDLPGMGLSSGPRSSIDSFDRYCETLTACTKALEPLMPKPWFVVAQSAGSSAVLKQLFTDGPEPFKKTIILAPLIRTHNWENSRRLYWLIRWFMPSIKRKFSASSHAEEFLDFVKNQDPIQNSRLPIKWVTAMVHWMNYFDTVEPKPYSVLIIQGDADTTVDWQYNLKKIKVKLPQAKIKLIKGAKHHLVAESAAYRAQVFATIKSYFES